MITWDPEADAATIILTDIYSPGIIAQGVWCGAESDVGELITLGFDSEGRLVDCEVLAAKRLLDPVCLAASSDVDPFGTSPLPWGPTTVTLDASGSASVWFSGGTEYAAREYPCALQAGGGCVTLLFSDSGQLVGLRVLDALSRLTFSALAHARAS